MTAGMAGRRLCVHARCLQKKAWPHFTASQQSLIPWVVRINSTKLQEGVFAPPLFDPTPPRLALPSTVPPTTGFTPNLRASWGQPRLGRAGLLGEGQATAPFPVLWFCPPGRAGLRMWTAVPSSSQDPWAACHFPFLVVHHPSSQGFSSTLLPSASAGTQ